MPSTQLKTVKSIEIIIWFKRIKYQEYVTHVKYFKNDTLKISNKKGRYRLTCQMSWNNSVMVDGPTIPWYQLYIAYGCKSNKKETKYGEWDRKKKKKIY